MRLIKNVIYLLLVNMVLLSCTTDGHSVKQKKQEVIVSENESPIDRLESYYGLDDFEKLESLSFTFNVKKGDKQIARYWKWFPKKQKIISVIGQDTFSFFQNQLDSLSIPYNKKFVNDSYWLLFPFHLAWDKDYFTVEYGKGKAPISGEELDKITIHYKNEGGYTPGDQYEVYVDTLSQIKEWTYYKGGDLSKSLHARGACL